MKGIAENIREIRANIPEGVTLVCVSKYQPVEAIREAYEAGERHFGESRVQELVHKVPQLPADICWHFIGHLQTNKVRDLLRVRPYLIESVDSERLLRAINDEATKLGIVQDVLLEVHVAKEETKTGFSPEELSAISFQYSAVRVRGLMCMATNTEDEQEIRRCFRTAHEVLSAISWQPSAISCQPSVFSAGMSDDYQIAIACGSNNVRIGSAIFGERSQKPIANSQQSIKAVFFDQDGVLYNSMPYHAKSWAWAMTKHGLPYSEEQTYMNEGRTSTGVIQELHERLYGVPASKELIETIYADKSAHFTEMTGGFPGIIPNVDRVLQYLHGQGIECWVVTGSGQHNLIDALNDTFNHVFKGIISSFDCTKGKPDPEPYLKAWERSGFKKEECLVVENAPLGVRAAKAAGLFTIAVNTGPLDNSLLWAEKADVVLPNMEELLNWLKAKVEKEKV
ncbi:MAG: YggS family pyridoxal phosphate-dependent enzyme [Paludibacteraceae bacterium]|nr:YggS family pyridoxal phosphate-dependent enzyme [Paludibacteraceae bacterium]